MFALARLRAMVEFEPPTRFPRVPVTVNVPFAVANVVVATPANVPEPLYCS